MGNIDVIEVICVNVKFVHKKKCVKTITYLFVSLFGIILVLTSRDATFFRND